MIRKATKADLQEILSIYAGARAFMVQTGNPTQWGSTYPAQELLESDLAEERLYVMEEKGVVCGVFVFFVGDDPTYAIIENGAWHAERPYGVLHRVASGGVKGFVSKIVTWAFTQVDYLRIDTHKDNQVMQRALQKAGFTPCGIIYTDDGSPRIAFDKEQ